MNLASVFLWEVTSGILFLVVLGIFILIYFIMKHTHAVEELKAWLRKIPIAMFFQDNKFVEWKPIKPVKGIVYDKKYGPFLATTVYVDKKTKNLVMVYDVDLDGDRKVNLDVLMSEFADIYDNANTIAKLRAKISAEAISLNDNLRKMISHLSFGHLKKLFVSSAPHNIKSKIEKIVASRINKYTTVEYKEAILIFGAIFGIIIIGAIVVKNMGIH